MNKSFRLMLRMPDFDGGWAYVYAMRTRRGFAARVVGEYGDCEDFEHENLRVAVDMACSNYYGLPIETRAKVAI